MAGLARYGSRSSDRAAAHYKHARRDALQVLLAGDYSMVEMYQDTSDPGNGTGGTLAAATHLPLMENPPPTAEYPGLSPQFDAEEPPAVFLQDEFWSGNQAAQVSLSNLPSPSVMPVPTTSEAALLQDWSQQGDMLE